MKQPFANSIGLLDKGTFSISTHFFSFKLTFPDTVRCAFETMDKEVNFILGMKSVCVFASSFGVWLMFS